MYEKLEIYLSKERLNKYLEITNNNKEKAIELYEANLKYSSKMYILLSCFEVFLRNAINIQMAKYDIDWILNISFLNSKILNNLRKTKSANKETIIFYKKFFEKQTNMLNTAIFSLQEDNKTINNNYLTSRLNFGFWTRLFNKSYEAEIWNKYLYKIFNKPIKRGLIEFRLNELRRLRNRIAHNECILNLKHTPLEYYDFIIEFLSMIDLDITNWLKKQMSRDLFK